MAFSDEQRWIDQIRAGDTGAFDALVDTHWDMMVRVGTTLLGTREIAEDVAQEVLTAVWQRREEWYETAAGIAPYLLASVRRRAIDLIRHERVEHKYAENERRQDWGSVVEPVDETLVQTLRASTIAEAIAELPERRRLLVQLRFYEGMTYPAIAQVLGVSTKSAEQLGARVLETLRQVLRTRL